MDRMVNTMLIQMAIDGACRKNGTPECKSGAGVFVRILDNEEAETRVMMSQEESHSSNQRGELHALLLALHYVFDKKATVQIITDSEYIFNTITKEWYKGWANRGWLTKDGNPVKNQDLWKNIVALWDCSSSEILMYHLKGHVVPIGAVTASKLLEADDTGNQLFQHCLERYEAYESTNADRIEHAQKLSETNNGYSLDKDIMKLFVAINCTADIIATKAVDRVAVNKASGEELRKSLVLDGGALSEGLQGMAFPTDK